MSSGAVASGSYTPTDDASAAAVGTVKRSGLPYLNPQTQEGLVRSQVSVEKPGRGPSPFGSGTYAKGKAPTKRPVADKHVIDHLATD